MPSGNDRPKLRPVEVLPAQQDREVNLLVHDPSGLADGSLVVSPATMLILALMNGEHSLDDIRQVFARQFGHAPARDELEGLIQQLDAAHYLESPAFARYLQSRVEAYRAAPARVSAEGAAGSPDPGKLASMIGQMLASGEVALAGAPGRRLAGLIAPHLDFARGTPCYADAYGLLETAARPAAAASIRPDRAIPPNAAQKDKKTHSGRIKPARRFVILGTNHFGRARSVVATRKDFQTALGTAITDRPFLNTLEGRLGAGLCEHEFDHQNEHSVELQVLILQYLLPGDGFRIVPVLCPDAGQPAGAAPDGGDGVHLRVFAETLGELIRADHTLTVVIAAADHSHVGRRFGDERVLDKAFLTENERNDRQILEAIAAGQRDSFVETVTRRHNHTRVCSTGCIYALMTALPGARPELLRYHQAVDHPTGTCVTCSAVAFWLDEPRADK